MNRGDLLIVAGLWTPAFCEDVQRAMDAGDAGDAEIVDGEVASNQDVRRALDITIESDMLRRIEEALATERARASQFFGVTLTDSVGVSCLRYLPGGFYRRHRDRDPSFGDETAARLVTVIVWLNSAETPSSPSPGGFRGGTLSITHPEGGIHDVVPAAGTLVAFPADWPHEVMPVTWGIRDVVVDWWT